MKFISVIIDNKDTIINVDNIIAISKNDDGCFIYVNGIMNVRIDISNSILETLCFRCSESYECVVDKLRSQGSLI